ncbi:MAG: HAMP domain-containing histidine kinase [Acidobacteria bacterium]|nr:HAMP domain-containing histidine kinase [Acidobacteriota bacterium]
MNAQFTPHDLHTIEGAAHLLEHLATDADAGEPRTASWRRLLVEFTDMAADVLADSTILRLWGHPERILGVHAGEATGNQLASLGPFAGNTCADFFKNLAATAGHAAETAPVGIECNGLVIWLVRAGSLIPFYRLAVRRASSPVALGRQDKTRAGSEISRQRQLQKNLARVIHELEDAQTTIDRLQVQRTEFVASAAHELKTPLTVAQSYLEILTSDLTEGMSSEQVSFVKIAYENVLRLKRLVKDLIDLAAIEGGEISLSIERVEITPIIESLTAELAAIAARRGVRLSAGCAPGLPAVRGDGGRIAQILRNLLDNALKYTPAPGLIVIRARQEGDGIVIDVEDTGIGIPTSLIDRVFDPFFRAPKPSGFLRDGSGLGLTISRRIVGALGGKLVAISRPEGGSIFRLTLPRWPESYARQDA